MARLHRRLVDRLRELLIDRPGRSRRFILERLTKGDDRAPQIVPVCMNDGHIRPLVTGDVVDERRPSRRAVPRSRESLDQSASIGFRPLPHGLLIEKRRIVARLRFDRPQAGPRASRDDRPGLRKSGPHAIAVRREESLTLVDGRRYTPVHLHHRLDDVQPGRVLLDEQRPPRVHPLGVLFGVKDYPRPSRRTDDDSRAPLEIGQSTLEKFPAQLADELAAPDHIDELAPDENEVLDPSRGKGVQPLTHQRDTSARVILVRQSHRERHRERRNVAGLAGLVRVLWSSPMPTPQKADCRGLSSTVQPLVNMYPSAVRAAQKQTRCRALDPIVWISLELRTSMALERRSYA